MHSKLGTTWKATEHSARALCTVLLVLLAAGSVTAETTQAGPCDGEGNPAVEACAGHTPCGADTLYLSVENPVMGWRQCFTRPANSM